MGMFDYLRCDHELPTYPQLKGHTFQTKEFECIGELLVITASGRLVVPKNVYRDEVRTMLGEKYRVSVAHPTGEVTDSEFHGDVGFYDAIFEFTYQGKGKPAKRLLEDYGLQPDPGKDFKWVEFVARFTHGQLEGITLLGGR